MTKNVVLSGEPIPDEERRQLGDGVFPYTFCALDRRSDPIPAKLDLAADVAALEKDGQALVRDRRRLFADLALWFQAIGTPCGLYLFQALQSQSKLLQSCCLRIATAHEGFKLHVPLFPWLRENVKDWTSQVKAGAKDAAPLEVLVKSLRTWLNLDRAVGVVSGESPETFRAARNGLVLLDKWLGGTEEFAVALPQGGNPDDGACPLEAGLPLGTNAMARSTGHAAASLYVYRLAQEARRAGAEFNAAALFQGSPFELFALAMFDKPLVRKGPEREDQLLTYLAASDLALFTPLHPMFGPLRSSLRWDDLHPGHRLAKVLGVIKEKELRLDSVAPAAYFKLTSSVCSALSWPEVPRFVDAALRHEPPESEDPIRQLFRLACEAREANPAAFFDPAEAIAHLSHITPPGSQLANFETSRDTDRALTFALEAELFAAGFQLFFDNKEPSFVCPDFQDVLGQLHSAPEMVKTYFGLEF